ncbi:MAG: outer membrane protein assembly factor BamA [Myxococcales bacterium]|nr:outer membrane protein assembly factor BamA [Myxococcales bacterium]
MRWGLLFGWFVAGAVFAQDSTGLPALPASGVPPAPDPAPDAPAPAGEGAPVHATGVVVRVQVFGLRRVEEAAILDAVSLRAGDTLAPWKLQRDIRGIWKTGYVQDVVVRVTPQAGGQVVSFIVTEKPSVREVRFSGNKKIKDEDLKEAIDIVPLGPPPSDQRLAQNARTLRDKYLEKGFYLATVEPVLTAAGDDLVDVEYRIVENRKVIVQSIDITGNEGVPDAKIKRFMQTKEGGIAPWLTSSGNFIESNLENDTYVVRSVLLEEGYVEAQVDTPKVFLSPDKRHIFITIHVTEGPRYQIGKLSFQGDFEADEGLTQGAVRALAEGKNLRDVQEGWERDKAAGIVFGDEWTPRVERRILDFTGQSTPLKIGDWFKLTTMQTVTQRVSDLYGDRGYAFANIVPLPSPDPDSGVVDLVFDIQKGEKMRIGRINITGNNPTFDKVVRREIPINEGEQYQGSRIREARERLERLGFFETVEISTPRATEERTLDMNVDVTERPTGSFTVGAGFSSVDSFLLTANIQKSNFFGLGWVVSIAGNISRPTQTANIDFYDPYFLDSRWTLRLSGFYNQRNYIENEYQRGGILQIGRYLDTRDDIRLALDYTIEDNGLLSLDEYKERLFGGQLYRNGVTSSVGITFEADKRNNRITATRGVRFTLSTELAGGFRVNDKEVVSLFGGDFNYWESKANFRFYQPLVKDDWLVFKYNLSLGHIQSTDGSIVPYIHRYRAGGILSIRGFEPYALGPSIRATGYRDYSQERTSFVGTDDPQAADDRLVIGGTETLINQFEIESPIIKSAGISLVAFFDAGNTFGDVQGSGLIDLTDLRTSVGFGVRWFSPIGPLRFEWGFPLAPLPDERTAVFDFTIGSAF